MNILIDRFHPQQRRAYQSSYHIDDRTATGMTVMDVLVYITQNIDPTLGIYSHSVCNHGICKRCVLRVNGEVALACTTRVSDYEELHLSPANSSHVIRDLVVHMDKEE